MLNLIVGEDYTNKLVRSFIDGILAEKQYRGWTKRRDGYYEDTAGAVYTIDLQVTGEMVKVVLKSVPLVNF